MIELLAVFSAGLLSFFSPCVFPLIPLYISAISGVSVYDANQAKLNARKIQIAVFVFVAGFTLAFVLLGASSTFIGKFLFANKRILTLTAGIVILAFSLHLAGLVNFKFLNYEKKLTFSGGKLGYLSAGFMGFIFALGWTPCIGPILAGVLAMAAVKESVGKGTMLLFIYSLGLGLPFIISGFFISKVMVFFGRKSGFIRYVKYISAVLLFAIAVILIFQFKLPYFQL